MSSIGGFIQDGTGKGYFAQVDSSNRLGVRGTTETNYQEQSRAGDAFNVNTQLVSFASTGTTETPLLYLVNGESRDVELVNWFLAIGLSAGTFSENPLFRVYGNPSGVSGGVSIPATNRRIGSPRSFSFTARRQDSGTPLTWTPSGTPVLYQTLTQSTRAVAEVNLHLAPSSSVIVTFTSNLAASTVAAYTGFAGFVDT
jgi:hypothetical protein